MVHAGIITMWNLATSTATTLVERGISGLHRNKLVYHVAMNKSKSVTLTYLYLKYECCPVERFKIVL